MRSSRAQPLQKSKPLVLVIEFGAVKGSGNELRRLFLLFLLMAVLQSAQPVVLYLAVALAVLLDLAELPP